MRSILPRRWIPSLAIAIALTTTLLLPAAVASDPVLQPEEQPEDWTCDASGQLVCAGANAGANVDCTVSTEHVVSCEYTYGQIMGGASPLMLPGHVAFSWGVEITTCLTDGGGAPIDCETTTDGGEDTCTWPPVYTCVLSLGPNETPLDPVQLEEDQCYEVHVTPTATATAWTPAEDPALASAEHTATNTHGDVECRLNNGR